MKKKTRKSDSKAKDFKFFWEESPDEIKKAEKRIVRRPEEHKEPFGFGNFGNVFDFSKDIEKMVNQMMNSMGSAQGNPFGNMRIGVKVSAPITLRDIGNVFVLRAELPGFEKDEIDLQISEDRVEIRGQKKNNERKHDENGFYIQSSNSRLFRSVVLPELIDENGVNAQFKNGVLLVKMKKLFKKKGKRIKIR